MDLEQQRSQQMETLIAALSKNGSHSIAESTLDSPIEALGLSVQPETCLKSAGIWTIRQLVAKNEAELLEIPYLGSSGLRDIKRLASALPRVNLPKLQTESKPSLFADPIHGTSEVIAGEILTSGAVIHFPSDKLATGFVGMAKPLAAEDQETASFHVKRLPIQNGTEGKIYPVYVSDEALGKLTKFENLLKLAIPEQAIAVANAAR